MRTQTDGRYGPGGTDYVKTPDFATTLSTALEEFRQALIKRWRELVCAAVIAEEDYPIAIRRPASPQWHQPPWDYRHILARLHLANGGRYCEYVTWLNGGQGSALGSVACEGKTISSPDAAVDDYGATGRFDPIGVPPSAVPPYITCGMGAILAQVDDWAWGERDHLFSQLPLFDHHDLRALGEARDDLIRLGQRLGLNSGPAPDASAGLTKNNELTSTVARISYREGDNEGWWADWTGLLADTAGKGFFSSVEPTLTNQARIAGLLANLYTDRATIIEKAGNDTLHSIQQATSALGDKEMITTPPSGGWKAVQVLGLGLAATTGWSVPGAIASGTVTLVGFVGENLDSGDVREVYTNDFMAVVGTLHDEIGAVNSAIEGYEGDYYRAANDLRAAVHERHSHNLELYDFTLNNPEGQGRGFSAEISSIVTIAKYCYRAGESYEQLLSIIPNVSHADRHLAGEDGRPTLADQAVIEVREQLHGFLKTTCGRYLVAGDMVRDAAESYAAIDDERQKDFDSLMRTWGEKGIGEVDVRFDPAEYAEETDRSESDPGGRHPEQAFSEPGADDPSRPGQHPDTSYSVEGE